jgi:hypothetical protein
VVRLLGTRDNSGEHAQEKTTGDLPNFDPKRGDGVIVGAVPPVDKDLLLDSVVMLIVKDLMLYGAIVDDQLVSIEHDADPREVAPVTKGEC